jgi:hypothetical protein
MKTTGNSSVDSLFDTDASLKSSHVVVSEFNMNSYYEISAVGCYTGSISSVPGTYLSSGTNKGWDNGNDKNTFGSDDVGNFYKDNDDRLKVSPLRDCFKPNRPDAGLVHAIAQIGNNKRLISDSSLIKQSKFPNSATRLYPVSVESSFKYWNSYRSLNNSNVGLSNISLALSNANPFIVYSKSFKANKIVIKTQKDRGYPTKFRIQYLNTSNAWVTAVDTTASATSTFGQDGKIEISYDGNNWYFVNELNTQSYLTEFTDSTTQAVTMRGVRFLVSGMSTAFTPLELIEISPRLVVNMTNHVMSFSLNSSIGDSQYGLPLGSIVSSSGNVTLSNEDRVFDKMNPDSIFTYVKDSTPENYELETMLRANVKFVFYQILFNNSNEYAVPIKTMYSTEWTQDSQFTTSVNLEDYIKFFRETQAPNLLIGYKNPLKSSLAIRMLLDNIGYNKFSFETKDSIDPEMNFFYCSNDVTVAEALNDIATSSQLSMFMDADNNFVVMTKDRISSRTAFDRNSAEIQGKNYWLIGNSPSSTDSEYSYINEKFSNIESISETAIPPITDGTVQYKIVNIKKDVPASVLISNVEEASNNPANVLTELSYVPSPLWDVTQSDSSQSVLLAAILEEGMSATGRPIKALSGKTIPAVNEEEAVRKSFSTTYQNPGYTDKDLLINIENNSAFLFLQANKYEGYVYINNEIIRYNGIFVKVTEPTKTYSRIFFNQDEYESLKSTMPSGSKMLPLALIVYMNFKIVGKPSLTDKNFKYTIVSDGRAQNGTSAQKHIARSATTFNDDWQKMSTLILDKGLNDLKNTKASISYSINKKQAGYAKISGPSSLKKLNEKPNVKVPSLLIRDYGQRFIHGYSNRLESIPEKIGTRMRLVMKDADPKKDTSSHIAGIAMHLTDSGNSSDGKYMSGYFLEVSPSSDGEDDPVIKGKPKPPRNGNVRLYRMTTTATTTECFVLGVGKANISTTTFVGNIAKEAKSLQDGVTATIFDLDLQCKVINKKTNNVTKKTTFDLEFSVYWQGERLFKVIEPNKSRLPRTNRIGMFVRDDSQAIYDYIYAYSSATNKIDSPFEDYLGDKQISVGKGVRLASVASQNNKDLYFEDFATMVREIKKFDVKFDAPTFNSAILDFSSINSDYLVKNYSPNSFGAKFWVYNTSNADIILGEESLTPLFISGIKLDYVADGDVSLKKYIEDLEDNNEYDILQDRLYQNKQMYGDIAVNIASEYIATERQANKMMQWIVRNASQERKELSVSAFCNPLLELGDKVGVFYSDAGYSISDIGDKTYVVAEINTEVAESGPTTSITLRECP